MKVSELLVRSLESYGAERAYGLVGTSILDLMDALSRGGIRYVSTRHEQVAVSMADAEGRTTGKPGVCFVHGGPGFLNSLVGLANAWKDCSPMFLVAGGVKRRMRGMDSWLEVPQGPMVGSLVKRAWRIDKGADAGKAVAEAYALACTPPFGPVFLEVPEDVWQQEAGGEIMAVRPSPAKKATEEEVGKTAALLAKARSPLIVAGGGMNSPDGRRALISLLSNVRAPLVTTGNGRGSVSEDDPRVLGRIGFGGGNGVADGALTKADLVICLGCGLSDVSTYGFNLTPHGQVVVADLDPIWDRKPIPCDMHIECDAPEYAARLAAKVVGSEGDGWHEYVESAQRSWSATVAETVALSRPGFVNAGRFLKALDGRRSEDSVLAVGQGLHVLYAYAFMRVRSPRSFLAATNMGSMGFVFPAALGAKLSLPKREVLAVMGDGEFLMTMQDMETAVREKIGVKIVVVNDRSYRVLLMRQMIQKMGRVFGTTHSNPDLAKVADSFGASGLRVGSDDEAAAGLEFLRGESDTPRVLELVVDKEDLPPLNIQGSLMF